LRDNFSAIHLLEFIFQKEIEREDRKAHEAKKKADEIERSAEVNFCKVICELGFLCKNDSILYILASTYLLDSFQSYCR